jgi:hypothetical protein
MRAPEPRVKLSSAVVLVETGRGTICGDAGEVDAVSAWAALLAKTPVRDAARSAPIVKALVRTRGR